MSCGTENRPLFNYAAAVFFAETLLITNSTRTISTIPISSDIAAFYMKRAMI